MSDTKKGAFARVELDKDMGDGTYCVLIGKLNIPVGVGLGKDAADESCGWINAAYAERVEGLVRALENVVDLDQHKNCDSACSKKPEWDRLREALAQFQGEE